MTNGEFKIIKDLDDYMCTQIGEEYLYSIVLENIQNKINSKKMVVVRVKK